jgi:PIN domain nuclease of toxin-antitoxin system
MNILLDTHIFLWYISGDKNLPDYMRDEIQKSENEVYLSIVSIWESIIKYQLGKLPLPQPPEIYLPLQRERHLISSLSLDERSVIQLSSLPSIHRDPFDRMLICQSIEHKMSIATVDHNVRAYPVILL